MPGQLEGKVALITGTGGGQGRAAALAFTAEGAKVVGCDLMNEEPARRTQELVAEQGGDMTTMAPVDMGDPDAAKRWIDEAANAYGGVDILYNNASRPRWGSVADVSVEDWHYTIRNELDLVFYGVKFAWPYLVARGGGVIINIGSSSGMKGNFDLAAASHAAAKAGVIGLTRQIAADGAGVGIRAVTISPGPIDVETSRDNLGLDSERWKAMARKTMLNRWGRPEEIANVAVFVASDSASFITGANIPVDGGYTTM